MIKFFYMFVAWICKSFLKIHNRFSVRGLDNIPTESPLIVVANHCSNLDPIAVGVSFPRRLRYLAKAELFSFRPFGLLIKTLGAIPVSRASDQSAGAALKSFLHLLASGEDVLLFPEGGRSLDGKLKPLQGGVALLASRTGAPVIPAYVSGTFKAMPVGKSFIGRDSISVTFGPPIYSSSCPEGMSAKECRHLLLGRVEEELQALERRCELD